MIFLGTSIYTCIHFHNDMGLVDWEVESFLGLVLVVGWHQLFKLSLETVSQEWCKKCQWAGNEGFGNNRLQDHAPNLTPLEHTERICGTWHGSIVFAKGCQRGMLYDARVADMSSFQLPSKHYQLHCWGYCTLISVVLESSGWVLHWFVPCQSRMLGASFLMLKKRIQLDRERCKILNVGTCDDVMNPSWQPFLKLYLGSHLPPPQKNNKHKLFPKKLSFGSQDSSEVKQRTQRDEATVAAGTTPRGPLQCTPWCLWASGCWSTSCMIGQKILVMASITRALDDLWCMASCNHEIVLNKYWTLAFQGIVPVPPVWCWRIYTCLCDVLMYVHLCITQI